MRTVKTATADDLFLAVQRGRKIGAFAGRLLDKSLEKTHTVDSWHGSRYNAT
jgi:hypothetical protein